MKKYLYVACVITLAVFLQKDITVIAKIYGSSSASKPQPSQASRKSNRATTLSRTVRVTEPADGEAEVSQSGNSSFNLDSTRFIVNIDGVPNLYIFDSESLSSRREGPLFIPSTPDFDGLYWSSDDPDMLFYLSEGRTQATTQLYSYNVVSKESRLIKDFSGILASGETRLLSRSQSDDNRMVFAWRESSALAWHYVVVWENESNQTYLFDLTDPISGVPGFVGAQLDRTGERLIVRGEFTRSWQYRNQPQHYSERTGGDLTGISHLYSTSPTSDLHLQDVSSIFATDRYVYTGVEPISVSADGWANVDGTAIYRKSLSSESGRAGEAIVVDWKGQELLRSVSAANLGAGGWHYDRSSGELYLRLPNDSIPGSDGTLTIGVRKSDDSDVIRLAKEAGNTAEILSDQTFDWKDASRLRGNISPDGRFFIFNSKADRKRTDVYLAAITAQTAVAEPVEWTNAVNCAVSENSLLKNSGSASEEDAGALSLQTIESGDGSIQFEATERNTSRFLGLTTRFVAPPKSSLIDFAIQLNSDKKAYIVEKGEVKKGHVKYVVGDTFKIAIQGSSVKYYKNKKLLYTSTETPGYPLVTAASLVSSNAKIDSAMISGAVTNAKVTINPSKVTLSPNQTQQFSSTVTGSKDSRVTWSATGGTVSGSGLYRAPATAGSYNVTTTLTANPSVSATALVTVSGSQDTTPPVISQIAASGISSTSANIVWATNEPGDTQVEWGLTTAYGNSTTLNPSMVTSHSAALSGLTASRTYNFRVKSRDAAGNLATSGNFTFITSGVADTTPPVVSSVTVINITDIAATITWTTSEAGDSQVDYGTTTAYGSSSPLPTPMATNHSVTLSGLLPGTTYNYRAKSRDGAGNQGVSTNFTFSTAAAQPASTQLAAYAFNEGSGTTATDASASGRNGTVSGATWTTQGRYGNALTFDGVNDKVAASSLTLGNSFTLMAWVRNPSHSSSETVVSVGRTRDLYLRSGSIAFRYGNSFKSFGSAIPTNSWQHVAVTYDGSKLRGYLNGVQRGSAQSVSLGSVTATLQVGAWRNGTTDGEFLSGTIDEVQLFSSTLTATEIQSLMNTPLSGGTPPPADTTPPVISQVLSSSVTHNSAAVTWTTNEASDTQVEYGTTTSYGSSSPLNTSMITAHSVSLGGLAANTTYNYRVKSRDASGNLATSANFTFRTATAPDTTPPTISSVSSSSVTTSGATVTWTTNEASDTQVEYGTTTSYGSSSPLNTSMVTSHSVSLSGLAANTTYNYRVRSRDAAGNLATSANFTFRTATATDTTPPTISSINASNITATGATITWTTNESSDTQVEYGLTTSYGSSTPLPTPLVTSHSAALTGLSANTTYNYRVRSRDAAGNLAVSTNRTLTTSSGSTLPSGLALAYALNEGSGTSTSDASGGGRTGSVSGASWNSQGRYGAALSFGGTNAKVSSSTLSLGSAFTLMAWVNNPSNSSYETIVTVGGGRDLYLGGGIIAFYDGVVERYFGSAVPNGSWQHVALTYDGASLRAYLNGVLRGTAQSASLGSASGAIQVGAWINGSSDADYFSGLIDEVCVYSRALSASEVQTAMNTPIGGGTPPPADTTPPTISGVGASSISSSGATVTWTTNEASDTQVEYGTTTSYGSSSPLNTSMVTSHSVSLSGLAANTTYNYRVRSRDAAGNLATSANFTFRTTTTSDTTPPVISSVAASSITSSGTTITWTTNEASDTQVEYGTTTSYGSSSPLNTSLVTNHSTTLSGLAASTTYNYRVRSRDTAGNLAVSGNFTFTTSGSSTPPPTSCPGFTIEGFGRNTTGGCGGTVYTVTNLNDSGPGSLREFLVNRSGPRIIRFAVSGNITLNSEIEFYNGDVTIDGSTAPNQGICVRGNTLVIRANNVIVRYMRFRTGELGTSYIDAVQLAGATNVVIDHCSISWGDDGNLDIVGGSRDITVQWCLLGENMGPGSNLVTNGATRVTVHHNLFANNGSTRNPAVAAGDVDVVNNVIYRNHNYGGNPNFYFENLNSIEPHNYALRVNLVGNYYKAGSGERLSTNRRQIYLYGDLPFSSQSLVHLKGNIGPSRPNDTLPETDIAERDAGGIALSSTRLNYPQVTTTSAQQAYNDVLAGAGATLPCRDAVDTRILNYVVNGGGESVWGYEDPSEVGGWPDLTRPCGSSARLLDQTADPFTSIISGGTGSVGIPSDGDQAASSLSISGRSSANNIRVNKQAGYDSLALLASSLRGFYNLTRVTYNGRYTLGQRKEYLLGYSGNVWSGRRSISDSSNQPIIAFSKQSRPRSSS